MAHHALLENRGVLAITGEDTDTYLQGLISCDVAKVTPALAGYSAFLTAQGKYLHDFFLIRVDDTLFLDCESERLADLKKRLSMYKLRSKVTIEDVSDAWAVAVVWGDDAASTLGLDDALGAVKTVDGGILYGDPRLAAIGARALLAKETTSDTLAATDSDAASAADYDQARLAFGLPDGSRDMEVDKALLLENGFDELNGVDWQKGCYMGQELTARTRYRGLVKKRLLPVTIDGPTPPPGTPVMIDDKEAGQMRSGAGTIGLALMRLDALEKADSFPCGDATVTPSQPDWVVLQSENS